MQYKVSLTYNDDKAVNVVMEQGQVKEFISAVQNGKVYKNELTKVGFWTSTDQLRHIIIQPIKEEVSNGELIQTDQPSFDSLQEGDEGSEKETEPAGAAAKAAGAAGE